MNVGSSLEVVTTLMGWWLYDIGWTLMSETGLVYIPLIVIFYRNVRGPSTSQETRPATTTSLKRTLWDVVEVVFVLLFFATPLLSLRPELVVFQPSERSIEGEVYDTAEQVDLDDFEHADDFFRGEEIKVPVGPALFLNLVNGLNFAIKERLVGSEDLRGAQNLINAAFIEDPVLREQLVRFTAECYSSALEKYYDMVATGATVQIDQHELEWIANPTFMQTPGLYKACFGTADCSFGTAFKAAQPIPGFIERPYCDDWWQQSNVGLRDRFYESANEQSGWLSKVSRVFSAVGWTDSSLSPRDQMVKTYIEQARYNQGLTPQDYAWNNSSFQNDVGRAASGTVKSVLGLVGTAIYAAELSVVTFVAALAAPMVKAVLMMFLVAMLPYFFVVSLYDVGKCFLFMIALSSIQFWGALWAIAAWVDQTLIYWLYPTTSDFLSNISDAGGFGTKRMLLDMITTIMYIAMPFLFSFVLVWAGFNALSSLNNMSASAGTNAARFAGDRSAEAGKQAVSSAASSAASVVGKV